jgi:molybdopterin/thiamine biosynthesis adenylyltransferase
MSTEWIDDENSSCVPVPVIVNGEALPPLRHPAEPDAFARHNGVPGHNQTAVESARVLIVGAGGLGSWAALALARSGVRSITIVEPDRFERSNASRQLMFGRDLGDLKAIALARNLAPHMIAGGTITAIPMAFADAVSEYALAADLMVVLVDNNACRLEAVRFAREQQIPAVFSMLSFDSMRVHSFLQGADPNDACLWCALPNLDPQSHAPCASATIAGCLASAAHTVFFSYRALMGWPDGAQIFNWRETDLFANAPDATGVVARRPLCRCQAKVSAHRSPIGPTWP